MTAASGAEEGIEMSLPLPEGTHLAYVMYHETESWQQAIRDPRWPKEQQRTVAVEASPQSGEAAWAFHLVEHQLDDGPVLQLDIFDDAWQAFAQIPEFFTAMAAAGQQMTLEGVVALLGSLGAVDETDRRVTGQM